MKTYLVALTTDTTDKHEAHFENTYFELFDNVVSLNEFINHRFACDAYSDIIELDFDTRVLKVFCVLANSEYDASIHAENILLKMSAKNQLA